MLAKKMLEQILPQFLARTLLGLMMSQSGFAVQYLTGLGVVPIIALLKVYTS